MYFAEWPSTLRTVCVYNTHTRTACTVVWHRNTCYVRVLSHRIAEYADTGVLYAFSGATVLHISSDPKSGLAPNTYLTRTRLPDKNGPGALDGGVTCSRLYRNSRLPHVPVCHTAGCVTRRPLRANVATTTTRRGPLCCMCRTRSVPARVLLCVCETVVPLRFRSNLARSNRHATYAYCVTRCIVDGNRSNFIWHVLYHVSAAVSDALLFLRTHMVFDKSEK